MLAAAAAAAVVRRPHGLMLREGCGAVEPGMRGGIDGFAPPAEGADREMSTAVATTVIAVATTVNACVRARTCVCVLG